MKRNVFILALLSLCLVAVMVFSSSCGDGGGDGGTSPTQLFDVTGTWEVGWGPGANMGNLVLHLTQDANGNITGNVERSVPGGYDRGTITSGLNANNAITITILFDDQQTLILEGTVTGANNMGGTSRNYYGDPNTADTADWAATKSS